MFKKISFLITTLILINIVNLVSADIVPIKKPSQSKEEKEKKLMVDVLKPLPKPIIKDQIKKIDKKIEPEIPKVAGIILPKKKPVIAGKKLLETVKKSKFYSKKDFTIARKAFSEMKKAKWTEALKTAKRARDKSIYNFIQWRHLLTKGNRASFYDYKTFIDKNENFPRIGRVKYLAEHKLSTDKISPNKIIDWFGPNEPLSGFGKMILGESLISKGNRQEGIRFIKEGWVTAEYSMLPGSASSRVSREVVKGKQSGRTSEIQRLIGRSLRSSLDLCVIPEKTIILDCDVIQADGGTRCAAITGSWLALFDALQKKESNLLSLILPLRSLKFSILEFIALIASINFSF
mgnify:CR=1 FL=1